MPYPPKNPTENERSELTPKATLESSMNESGYLHSSRPPMLLSNDSPYALDEYRINPRPDLAVHLNEMSSQIRLMNERK